MKLKPRHGIHHSNGLEDNDYVTHPVAKPHQLDDRHEKNEGESFELKDSDESKVDKDKDYYFMDTTLIGVFIVCQGISIMRIPFISFS